MNLNELSDKELQLYSKVISFQGSIESKIEQIEKLGIFNEYLKIHTEYSEQSLKNIEALKRGLFITWCVATEPHFLTGISKINDHSIDRIIKSLNDRILADQSDFELDWMLSYYSNWEFATEQINKYPIVKKKLNENFDRPEKTESDLMKNRGQMGVYWNSLN